MTYILLFYYRISWLQLYLYGLLNITLLPIFRPVKSVAKSSETGHATNVIQGLAISMESTAVPAIIICIAIIVSNSLAGLFGIAISVTSMLALAGMVVALRCLRSSY